MKTPHQSSTDRDIDLSKINDIRSAFEGVDLTSLGIKPDEKVFGNEQAIDHLAIAKSYQRAVEQSPADKPEGFHVELISQASVVLPSMGQILAVREKSGAMRPVFIQLPSPAHIYDSKREQGQTITAKRKHFVYTKVPHSRVAGAMVPKLKFNQEYVILNIYKSPYTTMFQVCSLEGIPEPVTREVELYGLRQWHRRFISNFLGQELPDKSNITLRPNTADKAIPLEIFTSVIELFFSEIQHSASVMPKANRLTMAELLIAACRLGGHDPFASKRDADYVSNPENEISHSDLLNTEG